MQPTAYNLRQYLFRILGKIFKRRQGVEIEPLRQRLHIDPVKPKAKLERLIARPYLRVAPEELIHADWPDEWRP